MNFTHLFFTGMALFHSLINAAPLAHDSAITISAASDIVARNTTRLNPTLIWLCVDINYVHCGARYTDYCIDDGAYAFQVSSIIIPGGYYCTMYKSRGCTGDQHTTGVELPDLQRLGWNDLGQSWYCSS